jgi:tetratricopeptide (TPR) repeat protein
MYTATILLLAGTLVSSKPLAAARSADDPADYVKQARRLAAEGQRGEALALYRKALAVQPDMYEAHLGAGFVLDLELRFADARKHLSRALELATDDSRVQALNALAVSYAFEGQTKESAAFYQQAFDRQMNDDNFAAAAGTANALGRVYLESGDVANARRWYQTGYETARRQPDEPGAQLALWEFRWLHAQGRIAARAGQLDDARAKVTAARALVDRTPQLKEELPTWHYMAGYVELYAKDYAKAIELLQAADPEDPFVLSLLARALDGAGQRARADETWQAVLESNGHSLQNAFARPLAMQRVGRKG